MASQGPLLPNAASYDGSNPGTPDTDFSNVANIMAADGSCAICPGIANPGSLSKSSYLLGSNYGFSIPAGSTINGIVVEVNRKNGNTGTIKDFSVRLTKAGSYVGTDKADTSTIWPFSLTVATYGGAADLWGTTWSVAEVNASGFGVAFAVNGTVTDNWWAWVDYIRVTVYYTPPADPPPGFYQRAKLLGAQLLKAPMIQMLRFNSARRRIIGALASALPPHFTLCVYRGPYALLPTLADGEFGFCTDTGALFIGQLTGVNLQLVVPITQLYSTNYLINGSFDFIQRVNATSGTYSTPLQTSGSAATTSADGYALDRWKMSFQTATCQASRINADTGETGITAPRYASVVQVGSPGKFAFYQIVERLNSMPLNGQQITFQCKLKALSARTIRIGILQLANAGTNDTIPNPLVSAWNANTTDPTWGTNLSLLTPTSTSGGTISSGGVSCAVTTAWQLFSVTVTAPSNARNFVVVIWSDSQFSVNDTLGVGEARLGLGSSTVTPWQPRPLADEQVLAQRYCQKSYDVDIIPGTASSNGAAAAVAINTSETYHLGYIYLSTTMRVTPTGLVYSFGTGAVGKAWDTSSSTDVSVALANLGSSSFRFSSPTAAFIAGRAYFIQWILDAEL